MDDIEMPGRVVAGRSPNKPPNAYEPRSSSTVASFDRATPNTPRAFTKHFIGYLPPIAPAMETQSDVAVLVLADSAPGVRSYQRTRAAGPT